ncbi:MAG: NAD(P)/FAD-dependent oxidoreductase [Clostridiales bacterium]|nr:NAD(P)/FAD-dependent oxidoreductase [Clostridiales bacterium]
MNHEAKATQTKASKWDYIILGSGIAGMAAAEAIRERDKETSILMISAEEEFCFNRPMLIEEFSLDGAGSVLFDKQQTWAEQTGIDVRLGVGIESIDTDAKTVALSDGSREEYDKLIYALGASVSIPNIPGADRNNVFTIRTREDMRQIRAAMADAKTAVVIGGGMLGLEDAWGLCKEKIHVTILEKKDRLAFGQIDNSAGNLMKKRIERTGTHVHTGADVLEIGDGWVKFKDKEYPQPQKAEADMVIISAGVTPNSTIGKHAGLETCGPDDKWIKVDPSMRTSDPFVFAAGDVAAVNGNNDAIWDEARQMGTVAGTNAAGGSAEYAPVVPEHVFNGFDTEVFTMADSSGAGTDGVYIRHADVEIFDYQRERYIRVSLQDGVIAGILLINAPELVPELMEAFRNGEGEEKARQIIQHWKESHDVNFKPATPFRKR